MDFAKLEQLQKYMNILSAIEKGAPFGGEIWQTDGDGIREIFHIVQIQVESLSDRLTIRTNSLTEVKQEFPIFVRLRYRNLIFKLSPQEFRVGTEGKLFCSMPREARALAQRTTERYVLPFELDVSLSIKRFGRTAKDFSPELEVRIIDVSESGLGIMISGANRDYLRPYDHFWIKAIDQRPLYREIFETALYVSPKGYYLKRQDVRVGLSLSSPLYWETFEGLKKKAKVILTA